MLSLGITWDYSMSGQHNVINCNMYVAAIDFLSAKPFTVSAWLSLMAKYWHSSGCCYTIQWHSLIAAVNNLLVKGNYLQQYEIGLNGQNDRHSAVDWFYKFETWTFEPGKYLILIFHKFPLAKGYFQGQWCVHLSVCLSPCRCLNDLNALQDIIFDGLDSNLVQSWALPWTRHTGPYFTMENIFAAIGISIFMIRRSL